MTTVLALIVGLVVGLFAGVQMQRRLRAERNVARMQRDLAEQDRDQALNNNVRVLDEHRLALAIQKHPAGSRVPKQDQR